MRGTLEQRFWDKVIKSETGCWGWKGGTCRGYGKIWGGIDNDRMLIASRVSWQIHFGQLLDSEQVLHNCDNPPCVRPDHLFKGSHDDNVQDCKAKGRFHPGVQSGSKHGNAKLVESQIVEMRKAFAAGRTQQSIADQFNTTQGAISDIVLRKAWKHVP